MGRLPVSALLPALVAGAVLAAAAAPGGPGMSAASPLSAAGSTRPLDCRSAHLVGLTVVRAEVRARAAGCALRLRGSKVTRASVQTIARASVRKRTITATVNPLCPSMGAPGPGIEEPQVRPGPAELISGLFLAGGPFRLLSVPDCSTIKGTPGPGTITVRDSTGAVVASVAVAEGRLATIPLAPGSYTLSGRFGAATVNEKAAETRPEPVTIPAGHTVRQDVVLSVP